MRLVDLLGPPIAFHRALIAVTGSITGALLLSQARYWQGICRTEDGFWWKTYEEWQRETGMSRHELDSARKACAKFLKVEKRGIPAKCYYRLDLDLLEITLQTSLPESGKLDCRKPATCVAEIRQPTNGETTSKTTSENTTHRQDAAIDLVKAFRERFPHYRPPADPKLTKQELSAATCLLASATANEVLDLAGLALGDNFAGNRRAASNLTQLLRNFTELRAQFGGGRKGVKAVEEDSGGCEVTRYNDLKTPEEVWEDWDEYCKDCLVEGKTVDLTYRPKIPRPSQNAPGAFGGYQPTAPPAESGRLRQP